MWVFMSGSTWAQAWDLLRLLLLPLCLAFACHAMMRSGKNARDTVKSSNSSKDSCAAPESGSEHTYHPLAAPWLN